MEIINSDTSLNDICVIIKQRLSECKDLENLYINVEVLINFDSLNTKNDAFYKNEPALHEVASNKVLVNASLFFKHKIEEQLAIFIHEIAHIYINKTNQKKLNNTIFGVLSEEYLADYFVCKWDFLKELIHERKNSFGIEYCNCLENWNDIEKYKHCMSIWNMKKHAGNL